MNRMQNWKISLLAVFSVVIALGAAADIVMPDKFYTWVKNPNKAAGEITKTRSGYFDTGVPARTGLEVEMDFQCDSTRYKNTYDKGLAAHNTAGTKDLVAPLILNAGTTSLDDSCICMGYAHNVSRHQHRWTSCW